MERSVPCQHRIASRLRVAAFVVVATACAREPARVGSPPPDAESVPARILRSWLASVQTGDVARHTAFRAQHGGTRGPASPEDRARRDLDLAAGSGGLELDRMISASESEARATLRKGSGLGWAEVTVIMDPAAPDTVASIRVRPVAAAPDDQRPAREDPDALGRDVGGLLDRLSREDRFSGAVLLAKNGQPFFEKAYGLADREKKIPNTMDTIFGIGSMNKMFTSVAVAQLVEQGKLAYTDKLVDLLPDYPNREAATKITLHHLLSHTSGLGDFFGPEYFEKRKQVRSLADHLQFFAAKPLAFEPGTAWAYSNAGMVVAGLIIERISGMSYFDYVRRHIYEPAGMTRTDSYEIDRPDVARGYTRRDGLWVSNADLLGRMGSAAGGGYSTARDLLRFDRALRGHVLLGPALTETITTGKADTGFGNKYCYGFGEEFVDGKRVVGHGGGAPGINTNLDMYWDSGYTVIVMANIDPSIAQEVNQFIRDRIRQ